jgi:hypothetical protein
MSQKPRSQHSLAKKANITATQTSRSHYSDEALTGSCFSISLTVENAIARKAQNSQNRRPPPIPEKELLTILDDVDQRDRIIGDVINPVSKFPKRTLPWNNPNVIFNDALH